jgi:uncharacterized protein CbrC (UPF0167 family)
MNHIATLFRICFALSIALSSFVFASSNAQAQNIALNKSVTASSSENSTLTPNKAVDGQAATRWSSKFSDNQWIAIDLGKVHNITGVKLNWQNSYGREYQIQTSNDGASWTTVFTQNKGDGGVDNISFTASSRYVRMLGLKRFTAYGFSLWEFEVYGALEVSNVALKKNVTSSSNETTALSASAAVDGSATTRWSSSFADNQWLRVDLGSTHQITRVKLNWQNSHATEYQLQISANGNDWTTVFHERSGNGGIDDVAVNTSGRYLRMLGIKRFTRYGFSLWEMEVYGAPTTSSSSSTSSSSVSSSSKAASSSSTSSGGTTADTKAPSVPGSVKASVVQNRVEFSWASATDNLAVTGYQIYRNGTKVADVSSSVKLYVDNNVSQNVNYSYTVRARDAAGNWSAQSSAATAKLTASTTGSVTLRWSTPNARENGDYLELDDIGGFEVRYKKSTDISYTTKVIADNRTNSINLGTLSGTYQFEIAAYDTNGLYSTFIPIQPQ